MNVFITGGAGYIGSTLTGLLLAQGHTVTVYDSLLFGVDHMLPYFRNPKFTLIEGDVRSEVRLRNALRGQDMIVHLAAIVGYPMCDRDAIEAHSVNVSGCKRLNDARGDIPVVYASTGSVYGKLETMCDEGSEPNPLTVYGETKLAGEQVLLQAGNAVVYRFATAFGLSPRLRLDLLVNDFVYQAIRNKYLVVYESHFRRTFLHVHDIARAIMLAIDCFVAMNGKVFNCGSNRLNATKGDIAGLIAQHVTYNLHLAEIGHDADQRDYEVDYGRLSDFGFAPEVTLEQGIAEMVQAFQHLRVHNPYSNVG